MFILYVIFLSLPIYRLNITHSCTNHMITHIHTFLCSWDAAIWDFVSWETWERWFFTGTSSNITLLYVAAPAAVLSRSVSGIFSIPILPLSVLRAKHLGFWCTTWTFSWCMVKIHSPYTFIWYRSLQPYEVEEKSFWMCQVSCCLSSPAKFRDGSTLAKNLPRHQL